MKRKLLLVLAVSLFACGVNSQDSSRPVIVLSFKESPRVEYFSKVALRLSYPEDEPYVEEKRGRFLPGDEVVFKLEVPDGMERTLEVFLYDPQGKPVYYRSLYLPELTDRDIIRVELLPSEGIIKTYELRSDGRVEVDKRVMLFSEDLYSYNGDFEGFLVGKFARIVEGGKVYFYFIEDNKKELSLDYETEKEIDINTPEVLWLTGSVEIYADGSTRAYVRSTLLTREEKALLCGVTDSSIYYAFSRSPLALLKVCESESCTAINLSYGPFLSPAEVLLSLDGILCRAGYIESNSVARAYIPQGGSILVGFYVEHPGACKPTGIILANTYGTQVVVDTQLSNFTVPSPSVWRIFSEDGMYSLYANCTVPNSVSFLVPYLEDKEVFVERLEGDKVYARRMKLSSLDKWNLEKEDIKFLELKEGRDYLLIRYELEGNFSRCHLRMEYAEKDIRVLNIPPYRRHIKLRKQYVVDAEGSLNRVNLRCEFKGGYLERRINFETNAL